MEHVDAASERTPTSSATQSAASAAHHRASPLPPPPHGRFTCRLRIYVYREYMQHLRQQRHSGRFFGFPSNRAANNASCLESPCQFANFGFNNIRQYTGEVPIYQRLVSACPIVDEPGQADAFLVPYYFGYMMTLGWQVHSPQSPPAWRVEHREMMRDAIAVRQHLPYLSNRTAHRHIILFSCDSQFVNTALHPDFRTSLVVHLGDDAFTSDTRPWRYTAEHDAHHLPNGITVPYRVSGWLPFGFNRTGFVGPRRLLLSMNVNMARHRVRRVIDAALRESARTLNVSRDRLLLSSDAGQMMGPREAAEVARSSTFCVCPTGDSKGFTARFYFVLLHGCLPIRVDGYMRNATLAPPTFPFPTLINWSKIVIDLPPREAPTLLPRLLAMSDAEILERQSHLRHVAHWLLYDHEEHAHHDAPAAVIHTIQSRLLARREHESSHHGSRVAVASG